MRVLFCRSNPIDPDPRVEKEALALFEAGFEVRAVAWDRTNNLQAYENKDNLPIHRIGIKSEFGQGITNLPALLKWQIRLLSWLVIRRNSYDVIHACDFDTVLPAMVCKWLYRKNVVYDIFDFYADHLRSTPQWIKRIIRAIDFKVIERADAVILVDQVRIKQIEGAKPQKLVIIYNSPDVYRKEVEIKPGENAFRIVYVGMLQQERGLFELLEVIARHSDWQLDLAGFGGDEEAIAQKAKELDNVCYWGRISYERTLSLSSLANVLVATYDPSVPNHRYSSPNKIFEAMMLAKPVVVSSGTGMDQIIMESQSGLVVPYGDVKALDSALSRLAEDHKLAERLGQNGLASYEKKYSWLIMKERLVNLYQSLENSV